MTLCRHCQARRPNRPRGLCSRCYPLPGIRDRYPVTSKFANRAAREPLDAEADGATPGASFEGRSWYVCGTDTAGRRTIIDGYPRLEDAIACAHALAEGGIDYTEISVEQHGHPPALRLTPGGTT